MNMPSFFDEVPRLTVQDPLARTFGCAQDGILEYGFADAVRLTGHACPTVATAYWLTCLALEHLYPGALPQRGGVKVEFRDDARAGSTGVMATVVQMLTGASGSSGFKGIAGRFARAGLIRTRPDLLDLLRFTRLDNGDAVDVGVDMAQVPADPAIEPLFKRWTDGKASAEEEAELGRLWLQRVRSLLLDCGRDPSVFLLRPVRRHAAGPALRLDGRSAVAALGSRVVDRRRGSGVQPPVLPVVAEELGRVGRGDAAVAALQRVGRAVAVAAPADASRVGGLDGEFLGHGEDAARLDLTSPSQGARTGR